MTAASNTLPDDSLAYSGYRFLLDASSLAQYSVRYVDGVPKSSGIRAYGDGGAEALPNSAKIFAFDDDTETTTRGGKFFVQATAYQIVTNETGRPVRLLQQPVEYEMDFGSPKDPGFTYTLTEASKKALQDAGFDKKFPAGFDGKAAPNSFHERSTRGGLILPGKSPASPPSFPPQHDGPALIARMNVEAEIAAPAAAAPAAANDDIKTGRYKKADDQTLVEKKDLGDGDTLKIVFNFESARVSEALSTRSGLDVKSFPFSEYDEGALAAAREKLSALGGKPKP